MISNLYTKTLYSIDSDFIIHPIYEYDISKANINILRSEGCISQSQYEYLYRAPSEERKKTIGLMERDNPSITNKLKEGFEKARYNFINYNNIQDDEIISIRKDAMFITRPVEHNVFGLINFVLKNTYSLMIRINKIEFYFNNIDESYKLDIKGIKDETLLKHQNSYLSVICEILSMIQMKDFAGAVQYIIEFNKRFNSFQLSIDFYREFNQSSLYRINTFNSIYYIDDILDTDITCLDISNNQNFNRELYKVISMIYFSYVKKPKRV